jgi:rod shape-determining protein MreD
VKFLGFSSLALLLLSFEAVIVKTFDFDVTRIDVGLAIVVFAALRATALEGALSACAVGYLLDVFTGKPTGLYPFLAVLVFLLVRGVNQVVDGRSRTMFALLVAASTVGHALLAVFFSWLTTSSGGGGHVLSLSGVPLQVFLTTFAGLLMWPLLMKIEPGERPDPGVLR